LTASEAPGQQVSSRWRNIAVHPSYCEVESGIAMGWWDSHHPELPLTHRKESCSKRCALLCVHAFVHHCAFVAARISD